MNWIYGGSIPELYKEVEILLKDGTTRKDMMIKGKYGNYEWRNYTDRAVLAWREITENKTNTKENKTMKNQKMRIIRIDYNGKIETDNATFEECSYMNLYDDIKCAYKYQEINEIDETNNGNVYISLINPSNDKIVFTDLYVDKNISMGELNEDIKEIKQMIKYRNEED